MKRRRKTKKRRRDVNLESSYVCDSCGEEIVIPIDPSQGATQEYVEDCPVCCCPNVITVDLDDNGEVRVWATGE
jgi:hypothetical protein